MVKITKHIIPEKNPHPKALGIVQGLKKLAKSEKAETNKCGSLKKEEPRAERLVDTGENTSLMLENVHLENVHESVRENVHPKNNHQNTGWLLVLTLVCIQN